MIACAHSTFANEQFDSAERSRTTSVLPTIAIEAMSAQDPVKTYIDYKQASVTRNGLDKKIFHKPLIRSMYKNIKSMDRMI
jgi:iron complex outermembrane receptor protein